MADDKAVRFFATERAWFTTGAAERILHIPWNSIVAAPRRVLLGITGVQT